MFYKLVKIFQKSLMSTFLLNVFPNRNFGALSLGPPVVFLIVRSWLNLYLISFVHPFTCWVEIGCKLRNATTERLQLVCVQSDDASQRFPSIASPNKATLPKASISAFFSLLDAIQLVVITYSTLQYMYTRWTLNFMWPHLLVTEQ